MSNITPQAREAAIRHQREAMFYRLSEQRGLEGDEREVMRKACLSGLMEEHITKADELEAERRTAPRPRHGSKVFVTEIRP